MNIKIELEDVHLKLLGTIQENWAKLGLGLDASEVMIDLLTRAGKSVQAEKKVMLLDSAKKILQQHKFEKQQAKKKACSCKSCKDE